MSEDQPKRCCSANPDLFTDTKVGRTELMWIVCCGDCGKYSEGDTKKEAIENWNNKIYS